jgi:hypothetical protein
MLIRTLRVRPAKTGKGYYFIHNKIIPSFFQYGCSIVFCFLFFNSRCILKVSECILQV